MANNLHYIPATVPGGPNMSNTRIGIVGGEEIDLSWWRDKSILKYNNILISAFYGKSHPSLREEFKIGNNVRLFGDSGGFQIESLMQLKGREISISPLEVLEWEEKNCDVGFVLDYPLIEGDRQHFEGNMEKSFNNFKIMSGAYNNNSKMKLYNILQSYGPNIGYLEDWYNKMSCFENLKGWGISCNPAMSSYRTYQLALCGAYMIDKGIKQNLHFLAFGGSMIPILAYLSQYVDNITFDSSSWGEGNRRRNYFSPYGIPSAGKIFFGDKINNKLKQLPCGCPVCQKVGNNFGFFNDNGSTPGAIMSLHNLWVIINFTNMCDRLKDDRELFIEIIKPDNEMQLAFDFIDYSVEKGFQKAVAKYHNQMQIETHSSKTKSCMEF